MARKKEIRSGYHLKFIPAGRMNDLITLANKFPHIKDKAIALTKYIELFSSIVERSEASDSGFVPVSQKVQHSKLGVNYKAISRLLKDMVEADILTINKKSFSIRENSYEYKPTSDQFDTVKIFKSRLNKTTDDVLTGDDKEDESDNDVNLYRTIVKKITMHNDIYDYVSNVYHINLYNVCNRIEDVLNVPLHCSLVPFVKPDLTNCSLVPCTPLQYSIGTKIPAPITRVVKIINKETKVFRPFVKNAETGKYDIKTRVYSGITNLKREFRKFLRLNDKELIGFDIANSQPLLACIAFGRYSMNQYGIIKNDVLEYQKACEQGKFYEYFMELNDVDTNDDHIRSAFKGEFFGKVFFGKNLIKEPIMMQQFKEKYPTCYEAMYQLKGGEPFSAKYVMFPQLMTSFESEIIWSTNVELIKEGYDVVNIFDSLYSDSPKAIALAKEKVIEKFATYGITPTLKNTHKTDSTALPEPARVQPTKDTLTEVPTNSEQLMIKNPYAKKIAKRDEPVEETKASISFQQFRKENWTIFTTDTQLKERWLEHINKINDDTNK